MARVAIGVNLGIFLFFFRRELRGSYEKVECNPPSVRALRTLYLLAARGHDRRNDAAARDRQSRKLSEPVTCMGSTTPKKPVLFPLNQNEYGYCSCGGGTADLEFG